MRKTILALLAIITLLLPGCYWPGGLEDPMPTTYTEGQMPGENNTGSVGNQTWQWAEGAFEVIYLDGEILTPGVVTETDPVFTASAAASIVSGNITAWNSAETDPVVGALNGIITANGAGVISTATTTGSGSIVLAESPTLTGTVALPTVTTTGTITLPNNVALKAKVAAGTAYNLAKIDTYDRIVFAEAFTSDFLFWGGGTGTGKQYVLRPSYATAGTTTRNSPVAVWAANYWNGAATTNWFFNIEHVMDATTPASHVDFDINSVNILQLYQTNGVASLAFGGIPRFNGTNSTGAKSAALGANCPAATETAPYTWISVVTSDGSTAYIPAWK